MNNATKLFCTVNEKLNFFFCLCAICIIISFTTNGQNPSRRFHPMVAQNTLPNNSIIAISQDTAGFMWLGSDGGLSRYDSQRLQSFLHDPVDTTTISSNHVTVLLSGKSGRLWVGTWNGLNLYDPVRGIFIRYLYHDNPTQTGKYISIKSLFEDRDSVLWVGTSKGLYKMADRRALSLKKLPQPMSDPSDLMGKNTTGICQDGKGNIWVSSGTYLVKYARNGQRMRHYDFGKFFNLEESDDFIRTLALDERERIWIGGNAGIRGIFDTRSEKFEWLPKGSAKAGPTVFNVFADLSGRIWAASSSGLLRFDVSSLQCTTFQNDPGDPYSLADNNLLSVFVARDGIIWLGTYNSGVLYSLPHDNRFDLISSQGPHGLAYNVVTSLSDNGEDELLVATAGGGVNIFNRRTKVISSIPALDKQDISAVLRDRTGNLWVGCNGLRQFDVQSQKWKMYQYNENDSLGISSNHIYKILEDSQQRLWIATSRGLDRYDRASGRFSHMPFDKKRLPILTLFEDSKGNIWIGSSRLSLYVLRRGTERVAKVPIEITDQSKIVEKPSILAICEDNLGNIWGGVYKIGFVRFNPAKAVFEEYADHTFYGKSKDALNIASDSQGRLWFGMFSELGVLDPAKLNISFFGKSEGISINEFVFNSSFKDRDGKLYFGTNKGLLYFDPRTIQRNERASKIRFTGLEVNEKQVLPNDSSGILTTALPHASRILLRHDQNFFKVSFALLNYIHPEKNVFEYRLDDGSMDWHTTEVPSVTFNNLAPGTYLLSVRGYNNDRVPSQNVAKIEIVILPPWWQTIWAYLAYAIVLITVVATIIRFLWMRASLRQTLELNNTKMDFFTNISHEIRTHLTLILGPLDKSASYVSPNSDLLNYLDLARTNAKRLLALVTELMDFRKLESGQISLRVEKHNVVDSVRVLLPIFEHIRAEKGIAVTFRTNAEQIFIFCDSSQLEKAIFNLLSNAFKFVSPGGKVTVEMHEKETSVRIRIIDDGHGIAQKHLDKLFDNYFQVYDYGAKNTGYGIGLSLSKGIIELHHGTLTVKSQESSPSKQGYTCFEITLPKGSDHFQSEQLATTQEYEESATIHVFGKLDEQPENGIKNQKNDIETILIADDNYELLDFIAKCLAPYNLILCHDGDEAWTKIQEMIPDLIITDVMMPGIDGEELCLRVKQDIRTCHVPVIMLTARAAREQVITGLSSKADHFITKPFDIKELELRIANLLALRKTLQERARNATSLIDLGSTVSSRLDKELVERVARIVEENLSTESFGVHFLAREIGMSRTILYKKVKALTGMTINDFVRLIRINYAAKLLGTKIYQINEIAEMVGFNDRRYFSREFARVMKQTPSEYAKSLSADSNASADLSEDE